MKRLIKAAMMAVMVGLAFNANANDVMNINCDEVANNVAEYHKIFKKEPAAIKVFIKQLTSISKVNQFTQDGLTMDLLMRPL